jgi:hypothetical protein
MERIEIRKDRDPSPGGLSHDQPDDDPGEGSHDDIDRERKRQEPAPTQVAPGNLRRKRQQRWLTVRESAVDAVHYQGRQNCRDQAHTMIVRKLCAPSS